MQGEGWLICEYHVNFFAVSMSGKIHATLMFPKSFQTTNCLCHPSTGPPFPCTISFSRLSMQFAYPQREDTACLPFRFIFEVLSCCLERLTVPESRQNQPCLLMSWCPFLSVSDCTKGILLFFRCFVSFQIVVSH